MTRNSWTRQRNGMSELTDFGDPVLSSRAEHLQQTLKPRTVVYQSNQERVPQWRMDQLDDLISGEQTKPQGVYVICCTATWLGKPSEKAIRYTRELQRDISKMMIGLRGDADPNGEAADGGDPRAGSAAPSERNSKLENVELFMMDVSEGSMLKERFGTIMIPCWMIFHTGRLVMLTNNVNSKESLRGEIIRAVDKAQSGTYLPDSWKSSMVTNSALDVINEPTFSLLSI